ncbi:MAG: hemerythrin domain-containing protein [Acidimicrobiia bacterium]|nr:hemerythrin domain-containing protein [Acidimicrobiia bacterium]
MPDGIELILADHRAVDALFEAFDAAPDGAIIGQILDMLTAHDDAEHGALYPFASLTLGTDSISAARQAHTALKQQMDHLKALEGVPLLESFTVLRQLVEAHVQDEESNLLPALREAVTPTDLDALGARILQVKQRGG